MPTEPAVFDARPYQLRHEEPFAHIMRAVQALEPGQPLRLINTFEPRPLEAVMSARGYDCAVREVGPQHWEVLFTPRPGRDAEQPPVLDNRAVPVAEAGLRTLQTLHRVPESQGLVALFDHDPTTLCAELAHRGYACTVTQAAPGEWRVGIRRKG